MNSLHVIHPVRRHGVWQFSDSSVGLLNEPFVGDANRLINKLTSHLLNPQDGISLTFSDMEFPGASRIDWVKGQMGGNTYLSKEHGIYVWLCPALLKYFPVPPPTIYVSATK